MSKKLSLSERKSVLYNKLSKEIENCNAVLADKKSYTQAAIDIAKVYKPIFKETQELLDSIFNGEDEDIK